MSFVPSERKVLTNLPSKKPTQVKIRTSAPSSFGIDLEKLLLVETVFEGTEQVINPVVNVVGGPGEKAIQNRFLTLNDTAQLMRTSLTCQ